MSGTLHLLGACLLTLAETHHEVLQYTACRFTLNNLQRGLVWNSPLVGASLLALAETRHEVPHCTACGFMLNK